MWCLRYFFVGSDIRIMMSNSNCGRRMGGRLVRVARNILRIYISRHFGLSHISAARCSYRFGPQEKKNKNPAHLEHVIWSGEGEGLTRHESLPSHACSSSDPLPSKKIKTMARTQIIARTSREVLTSLTAGTSEGRSPTAAGRVSRRSVLPKTHSSPGNTVRNYRNRMTE